MSYFLFFAEIMGRTNLTRTYHYNLVPFLEIKRFIIYRKKLGMTAVVVNLLGNVAAFLPFGFFLPFLSQKNRSFAYVTLISFEFSLLIECIQLVSKVGSFDVDDMILNTLGGSLGYLGLQGSGRREEMRKKKNNRSYKFTEKKKSVRGMIACVGAVISLLILAGMLIQAVTSAGNGGAFLGSAGVVALFVGVASFIEAVQAVQEKDTFRSIPYTAVGLSAVATVLWLALYMLGILL